MANALRRPQISIGLLPLLLSVAVALLIGGAGGYTAKSVMSAAPITESSTAGACALGSHPVVWYTARAWACVDDGD